MDVVAAPAKLSKQEAQQYYSQHGQDRYVANELFENKKNGFFIEVGAYDGISFSNTYYFEKYLGWKGICIEALPHIFPELEKTRNCICVNTCLAEKEGIADFYDVRGEHPMGMTKFCSGLARLYSDQFLNIIEKEIQECNGSKETIQVKCERLDVLLKKYDVDYIDYLSIDIEGAELEILKTLDFKKTKIDVLSVENLYFGDEIQKFLGSQGYRYLKKIGFDEVYQKL